MEINEKYSNFRKISKKVKDSVKRNIVIILIIFVAFLIYIPRVKGIIGSDAFEIIWMSNALKEGLSQGSTWLINPLSYFGYYPFSFYPIGFPSIVAVLFYLKLEVESISIIFSIIEIIIASIGIIKLSSVFFEKKVYKHLLLVSYIFAPIFIRTTYFTLTARGPILALTPWLFYYFFRDSDQSIFIPFLKQVFILCIMSMMHRLWISFVPILIIFFISEILVKYIKISELIQKYKVIYYIAITIIAIAFMVAGYFVFGIDTTKITSPWFSSNNPFGLIINLIIDYGLRIGILALLLPFGVYGVVTNRNLGLMDRQVLIWFKLICSSLLLCIVWTFTLYSTVAYLPLYSIYMIFGFKFVFESKYKKGVKIVNYSILGFSLIYVLAYSILFSLSFTYFIIFISIIIISSSGYIILRKQEKTKHFINNLLRKVTKHNLIVTSLLVSNIFFSLATVDGQLSESSKEFPYNYISLEEIDICNYLSEESISGNIYVSHFQVSRKIGGYGFFPTMNSNHHGQQIYYGWISEEEIRNNFEFNFFQFLTNPNYLVSLNSERNITNSLLPLQINTTTGFEKILDLNIQYAIILKDSNGQIYPYHIHTYGEEYSLFIESLANLSYSFETEHLIVWKLF